MKKTIEQSIEVQVCVQASHQWTQFESFSQFMTASSASNKRTTRTFTGSRRSMAKKREWDAEMTEQYPVSGSPGTLDQDGRNGRHLRQIRRRRRRGRASQPARSPTFEPRGASLRQRSCRELKKRCPDYAPVVKSPPTAGSFAASPDTSIVSCPRRPAPKHAERSCLAGLGGPGDEPGRQESGLDDNVSQIQAGLVDRSVEISSDEHERLPSGEELYLRRLAVSNDGRTQCEPARQR